MNFTHGIRVPNFQIEGLSWIIRWAECNHRGLSQSKREGEAQVIVMWYEKDWSHCYCLWRWRMGAMWVVSRSWEWLSAESQQENGDSILLLQENRDLFSPTTSIRECSPADTLIFSSVRLEAENQPSPLYLPNCETINLCCFHPLSLL